MKKIQDKSKKIVEKTNEKGRVKLEYIGDDNITIDKLRIEIDDLKSRVDAIEDKQLLKS